MYKFIQLYDNDCAFTCLKMMLANLNHESSYEFLVNSHIEQPFSLAEIVSIADRHGLTLEGFRVTRNTMCELRRPFILTYKEEDRLHSLYVTGVKKGKIMFVDPGTGMKSKRRLAELQLVDCVALVPSATRKIITVKEKPLIPTNPFLYAIASTEVLALLSIFAAFLHSTPEGNVLFSVLFIFFSLCLSAFGKILSKMAMNLFDKRVTFRYLSEIENRKTFYELANTVKVSECVSTVAVLTSFSQMAAMTTIAFLWSSWFVVPVLICLASQVLDFLVIKKRLDRIARGLETSEKNLLSTQDIEFEAKIIKNGSDKYLMIRAFHSILPYILAGTFVFVYSMILGAFSLSECFFVFALVLMCKTRLSTISNFIGNREARKNKGKLVNTIKCSRAGIKKHPCGCMEQATGIEPA